MDELTYTIQTRTRKDENQTSAWLKQQGISPEHFTQTKIYLLQAQKVATNLLKNHIKLLEQNQAHTLNNYLQAMTNAKKRNKLTEAQAHKVMNIGTQANRKLFKQHRQNK
jgi:poly-D-alanine transfer protein DltD